MTNIEGRLLLIDEGKKLIERLQRMRENTNGNSEIQYASIAAAIRIIGNRIELLAGEQLPIKSKRFSELTRLIVDEWPLGSEIGKDVTDWEQRYCNL